MAYLVYTLLLMYLGTIVIMILLLMRSAHVAESINISLQQIKDQLAEARWKTLTEKEDVGEDHPPER